MAEASDPTKLQILKDALYEQATNNGSEARLFTQEDLRNFKVVPRDDDSLLLQVIQGLTDDKLFVCVINTTTKLPAWRWRNKDAAKKYTSLPNVETKMVYAQIDEAGSEGIWIRSINHKTGMHESVVKTAIKFLESNGYIASMKNVQHPTKKMYITAERKPSVTATGGSFYTDGELDVAMIETLSEVIFEHIKQNSIEFVSKRGRTAKTPKGGTVTGDERGVKRPATDISNDSSPAKPEASGAAAVTGSGTGGRKMYLPYPAGYKDYPTISEIAQFVHQTGIMKNSTLGQGDIQRLVDGLYYEGRIEPIKVNKRKGYRVTKPTKQDTLKWDERLKLQRAPDFQSSAGNGLTETPCGQCPVFDLCEEGGPVSPSNCVYFPQWLGLKDSVAAQAPELGPLLEL